MHKHPTMRAWQREEDGSYKAELHGCTLHVSWRPEPAQAGATSSEGPGSVAPASEKSQAANRRGFLYRVEGPAGYICESEIPVEEIETAMVQAEDLARLAPATDEHG